MARTVAIIIIYIFEMLTSFCFFSRAYERKKATGITLLIGLLLFIPASIIFILFENEIINIVLFFIINFIYAYVCFDVSIKTAVIQSIMLDTLMMTTEYVTVFGLSLIADYPSNYHKINLHAFILAALICKSTYFIISQLLGFIIIRTGHKNNSAGHYLPLFIFPVLSIASGVLFLLISYKTELETIYKIVFVIMFVLHIFASVFIFIYYQMFSDNEAKINELESEKRLYNLNKTYMDILKHHNDELQMVFHDTKNHYSALCNFESIDEVRAYISEIYPELEEKNTIRISNNKMIDLIISKYIVLCKENNIKFNYEVKTANLDYIEDAELSVILNNILDNAVEAAQISRERQIEFSLRHINNMDLLSVVNSCDQPPKHNNGKLFTTKFDTNTYGFGTRIIEKHAKMNHGKYEWFYDDTEHRFHSTILFQRKNHESGAI